MRTQTVALLQVRQDLAEEDLQTTIHCAHGGNENIFDSQVSAADLDKREYPIPGPMVYSSMQGLMFEVSIDLIGDPGRAITIFTGYLA